MPVTRESNSSASLRKSGAAHRRPSLGQRFFLGGERGLDLAVLGLKVLRGLLQVGLGAFTPERLGEKPVLVDGEKRDRFRSLRCRYCR
jgi:hypothetical protein